MEEGNEEQQSNSNGQFPAKELDKSIDKQSMRLDMLEKEILGKLPTKSRPTHHVENMKANRNIIKYFLRQVAIHQATSPMKLLGCALDERAHGSKVQVRQNVSSGADDVASLSVVRTPEMRTPEHACCMM